MGFGGVLVVITAIGKDVSDTLTQGTGIDR